MPATPPLALLNASLVSLGAPPLLAPALSRISRGRPMTIVGIGSSITARHGGCTSGCTRAAGWLRTFFDGVNATWSPPATERSEDEVRVCGA